MLDLFKFWSFSPVGIMHMILLYAFERDYFPYLLRLSQLFKASAGRKTPMTFQTYVMQHADHTS